MVATSVNLFVCALTDHRLRWVKLSDEKAGGVKRVGVEALSIAGYCDSGEPMVKPTLKRSVFIMPRYFS